MDSSKEIINILPNEPLHCRVIKGLFSKEECNEILNQEVKNSFKKANTHYPESYRNNDRVVFDNETLAEIIFEKSKSYLPEILEINNDLENESGRWKVQGLNSRIRLCKYSANQYFSRHLDGIYYESKEVQSKLTFLLYLNGQEEFNGGRTLFFEGKDSTEIIGEYLPGIGDLIIFDHNIWHQGESIQDGIKYILRSDILYSRINRNHSEQKFIPFGNGHLGYVWKLLSVEDGYLLSGGRDKTIKLWNITGECLDEKKEHQSSVLCMVRLSPTKFISGSRDQTIRIWEIDYEKEKLQLKKTILSHPATILSLEWLSKGSFASSGSDGNINVFNEKGNEQILLKGHKGWVWDILKVDSEFLLSCSEDGSIKLWNFLSGQLVDSFEETKTPKNCLVKNSNRNLLFCGDSNGEILILSIEGNRITKMGQKQAHKGIIRSMLFIGDNKIASCSEDNMIKVWDTEHFECQNSFKHQNFVQSLATYENKLISGSYDGKILSWNLE